ncbi:MAG TPA: hypothetical protein PKA63_06955 [Oligoflexia bacterium]|nr:hypothetical protein [Oligoflexia bacterium]HMP48389.1 hypothetical protein [Oligoflexia bacterium]
MKFKLSEEAPTQHLMLLAVAGVFIFLSLVDAIRSPKRELASNQDMLMPGQSRYHNPEMSWYEKLFCRGYQRSFFSCNYRLLHPLREQFVSENKRIVEAPPPSDSVVLYRGHLKGQKSGIGGKVQLDVSAD